MVDSFFGKLIFKQKEFIYLQNVNGCREIYLLSTTNYIVGNEYFFYIYQCNLANKKNFEMKYHIGFTNLVELIAFKELILIDGIGIKTALKIISVGLNDLKHFALEHDYVSIINYYKINETIAKNIIKHYTNKELNECEQGDNTKIKSAINTLNNLGYSKELATKIVLNRKNEIIQNNFNDIFYTLISDIKNERAKLKTKNI